MRLWNAILGIPEGSGQVLFDPDHDMRAAPQPRAVS
jgi:hypothetical protein